MEITKSASEKNTVYVVVEKFAGKTYVDRVFASREAANEYISGYHIEEQCDFEIEETDFVK